MPFDPEATGIIPRLGLDASHPGPTGPDNPPSDDQEQARPEPPAQDDSKSPTDTLGGVGTNPKSMCCPENRNSFRTDGPKSRASRRRM